VCLFAFQRKTVAVPPEKPRSSFTTLTTKNCRRARKLGNSTAKWMEQRKDADGDGQRELGEL